MVMVIIFFCIFIYFYHLFEQKKSLKKILIFENNLLNFFKNINLDIFSSSLIENNIFLSKYFNAII